MFLNLTAKWYSFFKTLFSMMFWCWIKQFWLCSWMCLIYFCSMWKNLFEDFTSTCTIDFAWRVTWDYSWECFWQITRHWTVGLLEEVSFIVIWLFVCLCLSHVQVKRVSSVTFFVGRHGSKGIESTGVKTQVIQNLDWYMQATCTRAPHAK